MHLGNCHACLAHERKAELSELHFRNRCVVWCECCKRTWDTLKEARDEPTKCHAPKHGCVSCSLLGRYKDD
jgi:hypothetical protein